MKAFKKQFSKAVKESKLGKIVTEGVSGLKSKQAKMVMKKKEKKRQIEITKKKNLLKRLPPNFKEKKDFIEEEKKYILFSKEDERRNRVVEDYFLLGEELGRGAFAVVRKARAIPSGELCAVKIIDKRLVKAEEAQMLIREIDIMRTAQHVAIVRIYDIFESDINISIVMELLPGDTLFNRIQKNENGMCESDVKWVMYQIVSALYYLHCNAVAHRDVKPENILMLGDEHLTCRLSDFGLAKNFMNDPLKTSCGTQEYAALEILMGASEYSYQVDMWSVGVVAYVALCGYQPFDGDSIEEMIDDMKSGDVQFDPDDWSHISVEARDFIVRCLYPHPQYRMNSEQALQHAWFAGITQPTVTEGVVPVEQVVPVTQQEIDKQKAEGIVIDWEDNGDEEDPSGLPPAHVPPSRPCPGL